MKKIKLIFCLFVSLLFTLNTVDAKKKKEDFNHLSQEELLKELVTRFSDSNKEETNTEKKELTPAEEEQKKQEDFDRWMRFLDALPKILKGVGIVVGVTVAATGIIVGTVYFVRWLRNDKVEIIGARIGKLEEKMEDVVATSNSMKESKLKIEGDTQQIIENQQSEIDGISRINETLEEHERDILNRVIVLEEQGVDLDRRVTELEKSQMFKTLRKNLNIRRSNNRSSNPDTPANSSTHSTSYK